MSTHGPRRLAVEITGIRWVFFTICCHQRLPLLADVVQARAVRDQLLRIATARGVEILAYAVMPDQVHVLVRAPQREACRTVVRWKQRTGFYWAQQGMTGALWQRGFHDRLLRIDDDPRSIAAYIASNPVRAGLVDREEDYPVAESRLHQ